MSLETSGEKAPGKRSSLPDLSAIRNSVRFCAADLVVKSMSKNAPVIAFAASKFLRRQRQTQCAQFHRLQMRQALRGFKERPALFASEQVLCEGLKFPNVIRTREGPGSERMRIRNGDFVNQTLAVGERDFDPAAVSLFTRVWRMGAAPPFRV